MLMNKITLDQEAEKLFKGAQLGIKRIIEKAKRDDRELVISRDGNVVKVKARDL